MCKCSHVKGSNGNIRAQDNIAMEIDSVRKDLDEKRRIEEKAAFDRIGALLDGEIAEGGPNGLGKGDTISADYLAGLKRSEWFEIRVRDDSVARQFESIQDLIKRKQQQYDEEFENKREKLEEGDDLKTGVLKRVKVFVAIQAQAAAG